MLTDRAPSLRAHPKFLRVWAGQLSGAIGDQLVPVALSIYVVRNNGTVGTVAGILGGRALGLGICLLIGGMLADRMSRSKLVATADAYRATVTIVFALLLTHLPFGVLGVGTVLIGAGEAIARPGYRSLVPALLPGALLERGNALVSAGLRGSAALGALAGAGTAALLGPQLALTIAGVTFGLGAFTVLGVRQQAPDKKARGILADAVEGLSAVRDRPWVLAVMAATCVQIMLGTATALTLLPIVARREFGDGFSYGGTLAALALGALPAVYLASRWRPVRRGTVSMIVLMCYGGLPLSLAAPLPLPITIAVFAFGGFAVELYYVYWLSSLQRAIPPELLGRVLALDGVSSFALLPFGYALVGPAVAVLGETATLVVSGLAVSAASVLALLVPGVAMFQDSTPEPRGVNT